MKYRLTGQARQDLLGIWRYIARDNEPAADRFIDLLVRRFEMLGGNPYLGRSRDDLRTGYRSFPVGQYIVFYRLVAALETEPCVEIMHVIHGKRDIDALIWNR